MCSVHSQLETGSLSQLLYEDNDLGTKTKGSNGEKNTWCVNKFHELYSPESEYRRVVAFKELK